MDKQSGCAGIRHYVMWLQFCPRSGDLLCSHRQGCVANVASKFFKVRYHALMAFPVSAFM